MLLAFLLLLSSEDFSIWNRVKIYWAWIRMSKQETNGHLKQCQVICVVSFGILL